uniref:Uncharacterized protein n=1 Tax=Theropithecus gelada TaxID=9565 RepID=A0A8D2ES86_THEGE
ETPSLLKIQKISLAWWQAPVVPATREAEAGEWCEPRSQELPVGLVCLQLVAVFHENPPVCEHIPLHLQVQAVIHVVINLLRFMVSSEQPAQNPHSLHPHGLLWHSGIGCTLLLIYAYVPALPRAGVFLVFFCHGVFLASSPGMDRHRLGDDQPIFDQFPDLLMEVGIGDFIDLIGIIWPNCFPTSA